MTPKQWKAVLKEAKRLQKEEDKIDTALTSFCQAINPSNYNVFVEKGMVHGYLKAIEVLYGVDAHEHVRYYLFEMPGLMQQFGECIVTDGSGKEYDASNLSEYVKWIMSI